jgi:Na+/H+ antiporter NhaD/arsenite permease-like protein
MPVGLFAGVALVAAILFSLNPAQAATPLRSSQLAWTWALPFVGLLATIAAGPVLFPKLWHRHYGKFAAGWSGLTVMAIASFVSPQAAIDALLHALLTEYLGFIVVVFALFTVAGGILVTGNLGGTPVANTLMLALGTAIASLAGTTGAAMILVRPLIRANQARKHNAQVVVFFIFLAANIGGALTPFGNPPLFVGFLHGVDFFWTMRTVWLPTGVAAGLVLGLFFIVDYWYFRADGGWRHQPARVVSSKIRVYGLVNVGLIAIIIGAIAASALWRSGVGLRIGSVRLEFANLARDAVLLAMALISLKLTPDEHRQANGFTFEPILEVAILFAGIFVCVVPVLAMLQAGPHGSFAWLLNLVTDANGRPRNVAYFWLTGALSAFLDNAPTYLVFFELAGGDAQELMGPLAGTLAAISMGAVYMGALTYIGNAPNLMIYAIALERGIRMPSFLGYMAWSLLALLPVFLVVTVLFVMTA